MNPQNSSVLVGRISSTIRFSTASNGASVAFFDLAVPKVTASGQKKTEFFPVVSWRKVADYVKKECIKGQLVALNCSLSTLKKTVEKKSIQMVSIELRSISLLETKAAVINRNKLKAQNKGLSSVKKTTDPPVNQQINNEEEIEIVSSTEIKGFLQEYGVDGEW